MSTAGIKEKFTEVPGYLFAPSLILMLTAFFAQQTPVFDALPSEFGAIARLVAAAVGILGIIIAPRKDTVNLAVVCAVLTAVGIAVMYESGITYVFDIALMVLLFSQADVKGIAVTVFSFFACVTGATAICAYKGYIKSFTLYGRYTFGFRNLAGLYLSAAAIIICLVLMIVVWVREKETLKLIIRFAFSAVLSAALVVMCLKVLNLAAAVEPGTYPIYFGDTDYALEVRMKGFEDYQIGFGEDEATFTSKVPGIGEGNMSTQVIWSCFYPKKKKLQPEQFDYIRNYVDTVEQVIQSDYFADPERGYARYGYGVTNTHRKRDSKRLRLGTKRLH